MRFQRAARSRQMGIALPPYLRWRFRPGGATIAHVAPDPAMIESSSPTCRFQSFTEPSDPAQVAGRIAALRQALIALGLDGFVVPRADEHQGEYAVPTSIRASTCRRIWPASPG